MFLSHPYKDLKTHFNEVYENMINNGNIQIDSSLISEEDLKYAIKIIAYGHDFGKYNFNFQDYIKAIRDNKKYTGSDLDKSHQEISALFVLYLGDLGFTDKRLSLICASIAYSHHGRVKDFFNIVNSYLDEEHMEFINKMRDFIKRDNELIVKEYREMGFEEDIEGFFSIDLKSLMKDYCRVYRKSFKKSSNLELFSIHSILYSALVESDKMSASDTILPSINNIKYDEFNVIKNSMYPYDGGYRSLINKEVIENLKANKDNKIFTITSPTGSGKTITGVEAAILLRELSGLNRIHYVLPFTSIINQSYEVLKKFHDGKDNTYLMKFHSMSNEGYRIDDNKGLVVDGEYDAKNGSDYGSRYNFNQLELIMNSLNSGFTITTFNQLIESIISTKNKMLKKFNNFNNSVILIDEIQCLPLYYLKAIEEVLVTLTEKMNVKIIVMTATKPFVFRNKSVELLDSYRKYFEMQNRTKINFISNLNEILDGELVDEVVKNKKFNEESVMIICNTIASSLNVFEGIKEHCKSEDVYYLSTNIIPIRRQEIIDEIKERLKNGDKVKLVCTQLVEAGVDLDFNHVYRDLAPLSSIIQAAGRCNRESNPNYIGEVTIFKLIRPDSGRVDATYVYGNNNDLLPTIECLSKFSNKFKEDILESSYLDLIDEFYNKMVFQYGEHQKSIDVLSGMMGLKFGKDSVLDKFSLIEDNGYVDIFIPYGDKGLEVLNRYKSIFGMRDKNKKREALYDIKAYLQLYKISVSDRFLKDKVHLLSDIYGFIYVKPEFLERVYNKITGFNRDEIKKDR